MLSTRLGTTHLLLLAALIGYFFADLAVLTLNPWQELSRIGWGLLTPSFEQPLELVESLATTVAFALQGVALGAVLGLLMSLGFHWRWLRSFAAFIRAIHELFWALLFIQWFGLTPLSGVLALAIPYAGTFARVFTDQYQDQAGDIQRLPGVDGLLYSHIPAALEVMRQYFYYRFECALRASAVLGFIGLPTLGFHLESYFSEGLYSESAALLYGFFLLIALVRWLQGWRFVLLLVLSTVWLPPLAEGSWAQFIGFVQYEVLPAPLRQGESLWPWLVMLWQQQILPGVVNTLVLSQLALVLTGALALVGFVFASRQFASRPVRSVHQGLLIVLRTTPEYLLAYVGLLVLGPSMLPGVLALGVHTGAIISHLIAQQANLLLLREDASRGVLRYFYEVLPRVYPGLMSLLLYRWEVLMRESAILGVLGIATLGFYIDSAFAELRFDRALLLIVVSALLNMLVDALSRRLRRQYQLLSY